jgi:2-C-methyl-D-erythritol 2,4-cyclodiphosphate synthase
MQYKVGIGYDIHRLIEGRRLFIGGVEIPYLKGLLGHSDGDALLHAVCDALLGAVGLGDIGEHFPDTDPQYHNISSIELLRKVCALIRQKGYRLNNIDTIVIAQEPSLASFKADIQKKIAGILDMEIDLVNIKAKTNEAIGEIGRKEAIACYAVVSLVKEE